MGTSLTAQLQRFSDGDREVAEDLARQILPELHRVAVRQLGKEFSMAPYTATELINEYWLRMLSKGGWKLESRAHFYAIAGLVMRRVLIDSARNRDARRRGNGLASYSLDDFRLHKHMSQDDSSLIELGLLMEQLEKEHMEWARVADMHYFAGFTLEEIALQTGLSLKQVRYRWMKAQNWLKDRLSGPPTS